MLKSNDTKDEYWMDDYINMYKPKRGRKMKEIVESKTLVIQNRGVQIGENGTQ